MKRIVIGILAHVDSGKTTLSEAMLYHTGNVRKLGRVDHGDAFLDTDSQERARGITIFSKQAVMKTENSEMILLDTPGHVDFSPEMERTLQVLDYAILVISGTDGVQSHTDTLWTLLQQHNIPTIIFVNKMDLEGPGQNAILDELNTQLSERIIDFTSPNFTDETKENIAMCHEDLMEEYLESGEISTASINTAVRSGKLFPCVFGSALKLDQVDRLITCLETYTIQPTYPDTFGARVFKISRDAQAQRLTWLKVTGGKLNVRSMISGQTQDHQDWSEKITALRVYSGEKFTAVDSAEAGMVCAVAGLNQTYSGQGLGYEQAEELPHLRPVLTYSVILPPEVDPQTALQRFRLLEEEEPQLHVIWDDILKELRIQLMGEIQLEVLSEQIQSRFGMKVSFQQGRILYQETIESTVEGIGHFEPLRHYAEVHLMLEPGERGSGIVFDTICDEDDFDRNWQRLVLTNLAEKTHLGVLTGSPITDIKITLLGGKAHIKHTEGGDFRQATYRAVRHGLMQARSVVLEPWYTYRLTIPSVNVGRAISDIQAMSGSYSQSTGKNNLTIMTGGAPVSEMQNYASQVASYTHGLGQLHCTLDGYYPCHNQNEVVKAASYQPESDLANTPDSVFCDHGSATIVKWNQVHEYMDIPAILPDILAERAELPEEKTWEQRAREYHKHTATDKELLQIFERTYGPIKNRSGNPSTMRTRKSNTVSDAPKAKKHVSMPIQGPEYVLVDGYNMIFAWDDLTKLARENLELARDRLIDMMRNYQAVRQCELILVFDAYKVKNNPGSVDKEGSFHVVYTREAETADMYIERTTHQLGRNRRVRVATSDGLIQMIILGHGALRVPARIFRDEVDAAARAIQNYLENQ